MKSDSRRKGHKVWTWALAGAFSVIVQLQTSQRFVCSSTDHVSIPERLIVGCPRVSVVEDGAGGAGGCYGGVAGVPRPAVEVRVVLEGGLCLVLGHSCTVLDYYGL